MELKKENTLKPGTPVALNRSWTQAGASLEKGDEGIVIEAGTVSGDWKVVFKDKGVHTFGWWFFDVDEKYLPAQTTKVRAREVKLGDTIQDSWGDKVVVDSMALPRFEEGEKVRDHTLMALRGWDSRGDRSVATVRRNEEVVVYL